MIRPIFFMYMNEVVIWKKNIHVYFVQEIYTHWNPLCIKYWEEISWNGHYIARRFPRRDKKVMFYNMLCLCIKNCNISIQNTYSNVYTSVKYILVHVYFEIHNSRRYGRCTILEQNWNWKVLLKNIFIFAVAVSPIIIRIFCSIFLSQWLCVLCTFNSYFSLNM